MTHGTGQAILGLGDESDSNSLNALAGTQTELDAHTNATAAHGKAEVAGTADITTHAALTTGVHGAGANTLLYSDHNADLSSTVHGFKGIKKFLADGITEQVAQNEIKKLAMTGGAENDTFKLTIGGNASAVITLPAGGFANLTAAAIDTAMAGGTLGYADADCAVTGSAGGPFTFTFGGAQANTPIGNMTLTDATGAAAGTITDDGTGGSQQGFAADVDITVTGLAVGDSLADVVVYTTKAGIATQVVRSAADFTVGAAKVTVAANYTNNTNNQYLFEWVDLT